METYANQVLFSLGKSVSIRTIRRLPDCPSPAARVAGSVHAVGVRLAEDVVPQVPGFLTVI